MKTIAITTVDNPYNPITEWDDWFNYDVQLGYSTCERLAAITPFSESFTEEEQRDYIEQSINKMITEKAISRYGNVVEYKKVVMDL